MWEVFQVSDSITSDSLRLILAFVDQNSTKRALVPHWNSSRRWQMNGLDHFAGLTIQYAADGFSCVHEGLRCILCVMFDICNQSHQLDALSEYHM